MSNHSVAWVGMWRMGQSHEHQDRIAASKTSGSENRAKLYLAYKDHKKEEEKTRPIGTANTSNTRAFANCVSELLESVANGIEDPCEVISSEDMLHHVKEHNRKVKILKEEFERREEEKRKCRECKISEIYNNLMIKFKS